MVAVEKNQKGAHRGWQQKQAILSKGVGLQHTTTVELAELVEFLARVSIQRRKIDIGRRFVGIGVVVRRAKDPSSHASIVIQRVVIYEPHV